MKRFIAVLICLVLCVSFVGCSTTSKEDNETSNTNDSIYSEKTAESIVVDISTKENGYYSMFADVTALYYEGKLTELYVDNPILLAFNVSDTYNGGVCIINGADIENVLSKLNAANDAIKNNDIESAKKYLNDIYSFIEEQAIYDYCPT